VVSDYLFWYPQTFTGTRNFNLQVII